MNRGKNHDQYQRLRSASEKQKYAIRTAAAVQYCSHLNKKREQAESAQISDTRIGFAFTKVHERSADRRQSVARWGWSHPIGCRLLHPMPNAAADGAFVVE
jgi:hypothetical protein